MNAMWTEVPKRDRVGAAIALLAGLALVVIRPAWELIDPELHATVMWWDRGARSDPWGRPFTHYDIPYSGRHSFVYSLGPNGVDDSAEFFEAERNAEPWRDYMDWPRGDDFTVAGGHALSYSPGPKMHAATWWGRDLPGTVLVLVVLYLAVRQARAQVSESVAIEFVRGALIAAPLAALVTIVVMIATRMKPPNEAKIFTLVSWPTSVFTTLQLALTLGVLWWRAVRKRDEQ